jgi:hypothetical protein
MIFSLISRNVAGQTKKSTTLAITFIAWAAGNMTAPQIFQSTDAPRYQKGLAAHFCLYALFNITLVLTRVLIMRRNKHKTATPCDSSASVKISDTKNLHTHAFEDLTDKENPEFRYEI